MVPECPSVHLYIFRAAITSVLLIRVSIIERLLILQPIIEDALCLPDYGSTVRELGKPDIVRMYEIVPGLPETLNLGEQYGGDARIPFALERSRRQGANEVHSLAKVC